MKKTLFLLCGLGLVLAAAPAFRPRAAAAEGPPQKGVPEFYANEVVDQVNVLDAGNALGEPDGRYAEIRPGGEMTVRMPEPIRYSDGSDDGRIVTKGGARYGLAGLFKMTEEGESAWQPLAPGGTAGGFKLGTSMFPVTQSTEALRIVNDDTRSVFVDAVFGFRREGPKAGI
jgi:hypothetical protein